MKPKLLQASQKKRLEDVGAVIRARRVDRGISQEALALRAGIDRSYMGRIERGENNITVLSLLSVAEVLETTPSALLGEAGC